MIYEMREITVLRPSSPHHSEAIDYACKFKNSSSIFAQVAGSRSPVNQ